MRRVVWVLISTLAMAAAPKATKSRLFFVGNPLYSVHENNNEIFVNSNAGRPIDDPKNKNIRFKLDLDNTITNITREDELASAKWIKMNNQKGRLMIKDGDLYLDGKFIDLNGAEVTSLYEAIPWNKGILCHGRVYRKKSKERVKSLLPSAEDIEPYGAIWINTETHKGSSRWLYGKVRRNVLVFPLPRR